MKNIDINGLDIIKLISKNLPNTYKGLYKVPLHASNKTYC